MNDAKIRAVPWLPRVLYLLVLFVWAGCRASGQPEAVPSSALPLPPPPQDGVVTLVDPKPDGSFEHDPTDFTQGLIFADGALYESTGRNGESKLRKLNAETGAVEETRELPEQYFGEGLASLEGKLYQLTWTSQVCLVYDRATLTQRQQLFYSGEGWGLTTIPSENLLVFSDGSSELKFLDPSNFVSKRQVTVTDGEGQPVSQLNELEWVEGEVWANVWMTDRIARIDPKTGKVKGWLLLTELTKTHNDGNEDVLNGIAYDPAGDRLWITGKLWEKIYRFDNVKTRFFSTPATAPSP